MFSGDEMNGLDSSPVIILGMHRSGTTMLVKLLEEAGVFLGGKYGVNREAFFFMEQAEWFMRRAGGAWDYPAPLVHMMKSEWFRQRVLAVIKKNINSNQLRSYASGKKKKEIFGKAWGWKDPRAIFLIECWEEVFPGLKPVVITRNGIDVAASLQSRALANRASGKGDILRSHSVKEKVINLFRSQERFVLGSAGCVDIDFGFTLWEQYMGSIDSYVQRNPAVLVIKYEDLLGEPESVFPQLLEYCGVFLGDDKVSKIISKVKKSRAFAFSSNAEHVAYYQKVKDTPMMKKYGYDDIKI